MGGDRALIRRNGGHGAVGGMLVLLFLVALFATGCGSDGRPAEVGFEDYLVETGELARLLSSRDVVVVDARPEEDYRKAHIPGAVSLPKSRFREDLKTVLEYKSEHGFAVPPETAERIFGEAGVDERTRVIVYDSLSFPDASIVWATLTYFGHRDVRVLNGGFEKWVREGRPVSTENPAPVRKRFRASPNPDMVASLQWLLDNRNRVVVLDMRSLAEYAGIDAAGNPRGGHIPGAINVEWKELAGDGTVKPAADIRRILREKGLDDSDGKEIVTYCNVGIGRSTYGLMVLKMLGFDRVRVYGGSFEDWSASGRTKVATNLAGSHKDWLR